MQLKKNPRDPQFNDTQDQYEEEFPAEEESIPVRPEAAPRVRQRAESEVEPTSRPASRAESVIDNHSTFDGKYETDQDLRVQGSVSGEIVCRGTFTVDQGATAKARIQARDALIRGRLDGDIVCTGRLLLTATAVVTGTLKAATLVVEEGASLSGTVETAASVTPAATPPVEESAPPVETAAPAATASSGAVTSSRGPSWGGERRANGANGSAVEPTQGRAGRQAPSFAFVPTTEERTAAAERN